MPMSQHLGNDSADNKIYRLVHINKDGREVLLYGHAPIEQPALGDALMRDNANGELRWHPLRREWNIYAPARQNRTFKPQQADDPLAPMTRGDAPTEIPFAAFDLAIFENRFPSLTDLQANSEPPQNDVRPASGRCEVVVYGPDHDGDLGRFSQERRRLLVAAWIDRYEAHFKAGRSFVLPFENRGEEVGVTLHHPHGQIYAFDFVPNVQAAAVKAFENGYNLAAHLEGWSSDYVIAKAGPLYLFTPPFARFPFELWIASRNPCRGLWEYNQEEQEAFAFLLGEATRRYDRYFGRATPTMMSLHAAPRDAGDSFQFTTQFYPLLRNEEKLKYLASVEQATGVFTVDVTPEFAAKELRQ